MPCHPRPHRIEFDVAHALEQIILGIDHRRPIPPFPQGAGALVMKVEILDVPPADALHHLRHALLLAWRRQQMYVVGHEDVRMHGQIVTLRRVQKRFFEELAVFVIAEDRFAIVSAQDDMQWNAFDEVAGETGHARIL